MNDISGPKSKTCCCCTFLEESLRAFRLVAWHDAKPQQLCSTCCSGFTSGWSCVFGVHAPFRRHSPFDCFQRFKYRSFPAHCVCSLLLFFVLCLFLSFSLCVIQRVHTHLAMNTPTKPPTHFAEKIHYFLPLVLFVQAMISRERESSRVSLHCSEFLLAKFAMQANLGTRVSQFSLSFSPSRVLLYFLSQEHFTKREVTTIMRIRIKIKLHFFLAQKKGIHHHFNQSHNANLPHSS